jgi:DNA-binding transcriptional LysR family regulator
MRFELNLKQLRIFYFVARDLSFTCAAKQLYVTQPAVTKQIDALERYCGLRLFSRGAHGLGLTEAGKLLYSYADRVMQLAFEAEKSIIALRTHPGGVLRFGTTKTWAHSMVPGYMLKYQRLYPNVLMQLSVGSSGEIADSLAAGKLDAAIVGRVPYDDRVQVVPLPRRDIDELVVVVPPEHPMAHRTTVSIEEIAQEPFILREEGSSTKRMVMQYAQERGLKLNIVLESASPESIKNFVKGGAGISILSRLLIESELEVGELHCVSLDGGGVWIQLDFLLLKLAYQPAALRSFLEFLEVETGIRFPDHA